MNRGHGVQGASLGTRRVTLWKLFKECCGLFLCILCSVIVNGTEVVVGEGSLVNRGHGVGGCR